MKIKTYGQIALNINFNYYTNGRSDYKYYSFLISFIKTRVQFTSFTSNHFTRCERAFILIETRVCRLLHRLN